MMMTEFNQQQISPPEASDYTQFPLTYTANLSNNNSKVEKTVDFCARLTMEMEKSIIWKLSIMEICTDLNVESIKFVTERES